MGERFTVPYACPDCPNSWFVTVDPDDPSTKETSCAECDHEGMVRL